MTSNGTIDYERLAQNAMRGVIREILKKTEQSGLPGDHHFYVQFETRAPGVNISKRLRERYPDEMTIVLQHRFWDLAVHDDFFEVKLTFDSIPERLVVPFAAIKVFFDPSVRYALQFENLDLTNAMDLDGADGDDGLTSDRPDGSPRPLAPVAPAPVARIDRAGAGGMPTLVSIDNTTERSGDDDGDRGAQTAEDADAQLDEFLALDTPGNAETELSATASDEGDAPPEEADATTDDEPDAEASNDEGERGVVVSLDSFRKK